MNVSTLNSLHYKAKCPCLCVLLSSTYLSRKYSLLLFWVGLSRRKARDLQSTLPAWATDLVCCHIKRRHFNEETFTQLSKEFSFKCSNFTPSAAMAGRLFTLNFADFSHNILAETQIQSIQSGTCHLNYQSNRANIWKMLAAFPVTVETPHCIFFRQTLISDDNKQTVIEDWWKTKAKFVHHTSLR